LHPHIDFGGQSEAAFHFYARCLDGTVVTMLTWGASPMAKGVPSARHVKICHANRSFGNFELAGVAQPREHHKKPTGFQLLLNFDDPQEAGVRFQALSENGVIELPLQQTFWSIRYGILLDQFGIRYEINAPAPQ
jgi:PhnB protein